MLLDLALKSALLLSAAALVCALARRAPAAYRHFVWTLAIFGVLALPLLAAGPWRLPLLPQRAASVPGAGLAQPRGERGPRLRPVDPAPVARSESPATEPMAPAPDGARSSIIGNVTLAQVTLAVYLAGVALCLLRLLGSAVALRRIMREARDVYEDDWIDALEPALRQLDVTADVRLVASSRAVMPMTFGAVRPVVVLPGNADAWTPELRRMVLLHELAHVRRRDMIVNVAAQVACAVYWFNPLMWVVSRRLRHEAERAADDLVLAAGAAPSRYAAHLLDMVQAVLARRAPALALPMAQRSAFEGRVLAILAPGIARGTLTWRGVVAGCMVAVLVALPLAALTPREVRGVVQEPAASIRAAAPETVASGSARTQTDTAVTTRTATNSVIADAPAVLDGATGARKDEPRQYSSSAALALIGALDDADVAVRVAAARALGDRADTVAINALLAALRRDTSPQVREAAAWALGEIEDARAVNGLVAALREERERVVRLAIVHALGEIESETAVTGLAAALRGEDDAELRRRMVWALGEIESADAVPALLPLLRDADAETRSQAVWALGEIESPTAVDGLVAMLSGERNAEVRARIIWALAEIEDIRAAPALEAALRDGDVAVRRSAARGLGELDGLRTMPAGLLAAMRDADPEVRMLAAHAAGEIQDVSAVQPLILLLRDTSVDVRRAAVHALGEMRSASAAEALVAALRDEDPEIRRLAAQALGNR